MGAVRGTEDIDSWIPDDKGGVRKLFHFVGGQGQEGGVDPSFCEQDFEKADTGEGGWVAMDGRDLVERKFMSEEDALNFAQGADPDAIEDVVMIFENHLDDADESGVEFSAGEPFCEFGRRLEDEIVFEAAGEGDGIEVGDGADAKGFGGFG